MKSVQTAHNYAKNYGFVVGVSSGGAQMDCEFLACFYPVLWCARAIVGDSDIFNRCARDRLGLLLL